MAINVRIASDAAKVWGREPGEMSHACPAPVSSVLGPRGASAMLVLDQSRVKGLGDASQTRPTCGCKLGDGAKSTCAMRIRMSDQCLSLPPLSQQGLGHHIQLGNSRHLLFKIDYLRHSTQDSVYASFSCSPSFNVADPSREAGGIVALKRPHLTAGQNDLLIW